MNGTREPQTVVMTEGQKLAIGWMHYRGDPNQNFCTGTLITPRVVATAEHCVADVQAGQVSFGVGLLPSAPRGTVNVAQIFAHPTLDAAILVLERDMTDLVPDLTPIAYNARPISGTLVGNQVDASGYGETMDRNRTGRYFAAVRVLAIEDTAVIVDGEGVQGICFGDSGGPILTVIDGELMTLGVESFGEQSCVGQDNLTRLDVIDEWIRGIIGGEPVPPDPDGCGDIDYLGVCEGDVARWCEDGALRAVDCATEEMTCGFVDDATGFYCVPRAGGCGDISYQGECQGDVAVWCQDDAVARLDCVERGEICQFVNDEVGYFCVAEDTPAPDGGVEPNPDPDSGVDPEPNPDLDSGVPEPDSGVPEPDSGSDPTPAPSPDSGTEPEPTADGGTDQDEILPVGGGSSGCTSAPGRSTPYGLLPLAFAPLLALRRRR